MSLFHDLVLQDAQLNRGEASTRPVSRQFRSLQGNLVEVHGQLLSGKESGADLFKPLLTSCFVLVPQFLTQLCTADQRKPVHSEAYLFTLGCLRFIFHSKKTLNRGCPETGGGGRVLRTRDRHSVRTMQAPRQPITHSYEMSIKQTMFFQLDHSQRSIPSLRQKQQLLEASWSSQVASPLAVLPCCAWFPSLNAHQEAALSCTHLS